MEYITEDIKTMKKLVDLAMDIDKDSETFKDGDILYVTGASLSKYPELYNYGFYNSGFIFKGEVSINTRKHWWQFWKSKESLAIKFIYKSENYKENKELREIYKSPKIELK